MQNQSSFFDRHRLILKGAIIAFLTLLMLVPAAFISHLVEERARRQQQVVDEVSSKWAGPQTIGGPILMLPYNYTSMGGDKKPVTIRKAAYILPEALRIRGEVNPEVRARSLYRVMLYRSDLQLEGNFAPLPLQSLGINPDDVLWSEARLLIGIDDARGLEEEVVVNWSGAAVSTEAGLPETEILHNGLSAPVTVSAGNGTIAFNMRIRLRGSGNLYFTPVGKNTEVMLRSPWPHPAFDGQYLPNGAAEINKDGFSARWKVLAASRPYPQAWKGGAPDVLGTAFGVRLIQPTDSYAKTERSVKYALLFIGLTFAVFFFLEILQRRAVHPLQYALVGFALCIFYTLLLSISEYIGFNPAYGIAAAATVMLISIYVRGLFHNTRTATGFGAALGGLYGYIYILIQLEAYALLFGSIGLFIILALLMYFSRKVDWYGAETAKNEPGDADGWTVDPPANV